MTRAIVSPVFFAVVASLSCVAATFADANWPQFRGPGGQGHAHVSSAPTVWSEDENIRWKTPLPGRGWSSPVVWGDQIWMTTAIEERATEEEAAAHKTDAPTDHLDMNVLRSVSLRALCVQRSDGQLLHDTELFQRDWPEPVHALNSYASPTPVIEAGRVYCNFGTWGTGCIDTTTGDIVWTNDNYHLRHFVGPGSSPVSVENLVVLTCDGADKQFLLALDKQTGDERWRTSRPPIRSENPDFRKSYCTPLIIDAAGRKQLVSPGAQWIVSYEPLTGNELWRVDHGPGFSLVARPLFDGTHVFVCTGYGGKTRLLAIRPDGAGDVTDTHVTWTVDRQVPVMPSPILVGDLLITIQDGGVAICRNRESGEEYWRERVGGKYSASPVLAAGNVYFSSHDGTTTVITPREKYEQVAKNRLDGQLMASPVPLDDGLLLRTDRALYLVVD